MLRLCRGQGFCECVGSVVISGTKYKLNGAFFDNITDEVEADVDVLCLCMLLVIFSELDGGFVVRKEGGRVEGYVKDL